MAFDFHMEKVEHQIYSYAEHLIKSMREMEQGFVPGGIVYQGHSKDIAFLSIQACLFHPLPFFFISSNRTTVG
jgi:hypothetical protein